jgi:host factor-I protein
MALTEDNGSSQEPSRTGAMDKPRSRVPGLQEPFLSRARDTKVPLTVFLVNGVRLQGVVAWFDSFSLLLTRGADAQLVYKHAISTIAPLQPLRLHEPEEHPKQADRTSRRPQVVVKRLVL